MRKGFTLVELSIVLVIIGLLIGGILVAQSMIGTARLQKIISVAQQYETAGRNFKTTYGYWPGDYPRADFGCAGNGDGSMTYRYTGGNQACVLSGYGQYEGTNYFVQLSRAGYIPDVLNYITTSDETNGTNTRIMPGVNIPNGPDKSSVFVISNTESVIAPTGDNPQGGMSIPIVVNTGSSHKLGDSFLFYSKYGTTISNGVSGNNPRNILTTAEALSIDRKMDDGMPNTGRVMALPHGRKIIPRDAGVQVVEGLSIFLIISLI